MKTAKDMALQWGDIITFKDTHQGEIIGYPKDDDISVNIVLYNPIVSPSGKELHVINVLVKDLKIG